MHNNRCECICTHTQLQFRRRQSQCWGYIGLWHSQVTITTQQWCKHAQSTWFEIVDVMQLNLASAGSRKGKPSSTGGTTANTRPTDVPDMADGEAQDMADLGPEPHPQPHVEGVNFAVPEEMPQGTPPPVPEGLPVVSLTDIALMEQKTGVRGRRVKSRRGSTTASHASLPQIPENVEITPLHARTERSDSLRDRVSVCQQGVNRLAEVQELEVAACLLHTALHCSHTFR